MLTFAKHGWNHYTQDLRKTGKIHPHGPDWEFMACLDGCMSEDLGHSDETYGMRAHTLWVFPAWYRHGWRSNAPCNRVVMHFSMVPTRLEQLIPGRGYYRVSISDDDCSRLRILASQAMAAHTTPTELQVLQDDTILGELSLMALREIQAAPLSGKDLALQKVQMAMNWYAQHMEDTPDETAIARAVNLSPSYLRRLFHNGLGTSPKNTFTRMRMEAVLRLLEEPGTTLDTISERTGFASASTLSRAIKHHFGIGLRELRDRARTNANRFKQ